MKFAALNIKSGAYGSLGGSDFGGTLGPLFIGVLVSRCYFDEKAIFIACIHRSFIGLHT
jgi:hypothetical protein